MKSGSAADPAESARSAFALQIGHANAGDPVRLYQACAPPYQQTHLLFSLYFSPVGSRFTPLF